MKKKLGGVFFSLALVAFSLVILSSFVSAAEIASQIENFLDEASASLDVIFRYTLGDEGLDSSTLFVKILIFIVMLSILYIAVDKVPGIRENTWVVWVVSIVVAILGTRFLTTEELVNLVWLPSGVVGIALTSLLPFIIYFFFVESFDSSVIRRTAWVFFVILFFGLAIVRWDDFAASGEGAIGWNLAWIYILTAVLSILSFVFDKTIHSKFIMAAIEKKGAELHALNVANLQNDIQRWRAIIANPASTDAQVQTAKNQIKDLERRIKTLLKS